MPSLARKVIIAAAMDGLLIQPLATKKEHKASPPVRLRYGDAAISFVSRDGLPDLSKPNSSFEAFGIVGESAQQGLNHIPRAVALLAFSLKPMLISISYNQVSSQSPASAISFQSPAASRSL